MIGNQSSIKHDLGGDVNSSSQGAESSLEMHLINMQNKKMDDSKVTEENKTEKGKINRNNKKRSSTNVVDRLLEEMDQTDKENTRVVDKF